MSGHDQSDASERPRGQQPQCRAQIQHGQERLRVSDAFGWGDIVQLAQTGRGADPFGERAEFVQLVRAAQNARGVNED